MLLDLTDPDALIARLVPLAEDFLAEEIEGIAEVVAHFLKASVDACLGDRVASFGVEAAFHVVVDGCFGVPAGRHGGFLQAQIEVHRLSQTAFKLRVGARLIAHDDQL